MGYCVKKSSGEILWQAIHDNHERNFRGLSEKELIINVEEMDPCFVWHNYFDNSAARSENPMVNFSANLNYI